MSRILAKRHTDEADLLARCEEVLEKARDALKDGLEALNTIRAKRLYLLAGYSRFDQYCADRWGLKRSTLFRYLAGGDDGDEEAPHEHGAVQTPTSLPADDEPKRVRAGSDERHHEPEADVPPPAEVNGQKSRRKSDEVVENWAIAFQSVLEQVSELRSSILALSRMRCGGGLPQTIFRDLDRLKDDLRMAMPVACPACVGSGCRSCKMEGWVYAMQSRQIEQDMRSKRRAVRR